MKRAMAWPLGLLVAGCVDLGSSSSTTTTTPITGLKLPAEEVIAAHGCGQEPTQVFKYAVYVSNQDAFHVAGLYDCFTDAYFVDLPTSGSTGEAYSVEVQGFNRTEFDVGAAAINAGVQSGDPAGIVPTFHFTCSATQQNEAQVIVRCTAG